MKGGGEGEVVVARSAAGSMSPSSDADITDLELTEVQVTWWCGVTFESSTTLRCSTFSPGQSEIKHEKASSLSSTIVVLCLSLRSVGDCSLLKSSCKVKRKRQRKQEQKEKGRGGKRKTERSESNARENVAGRVWERWERGLQKSRGKAEEVEEG